MAWQVLWRAWMFSPLLLVRLLLAGLLLARLARAPGPW